MNISISPVLGFQLGADYIQDVVGDDGISYDLLRVSLGVIFIHIVLNVDA